MEEITKLAEDAETERTEVAETLQMVHQCIGSRVTEADLMNGAE